VSIRSPSQNDGSDNPLYIADINKRGLQPNWPGQQEIMFLETMTPYYDAAYSYTDFLDFNQTLDGQPHGAVHVDTDGGRDGAYDFFRRRVDDGDDIRRGGADQPAPRVDVPVLEQSRSTFHDESACIICAVDKGLSSPRNITPSLRRFKTPARHRCQPLS